MTQCQVCGAVIRDDMKFCVTCTIDRARSQALKTNPNMNPNQGGSPDVVVCFVCGERLGADINQCVKCGTLKQDHAKVLKWYQKSAKDGDDCAQERLGDMYLRGIGIDQNFKKALEWYAKSAEQGNDTSKAQLGYMHEQGLGVDRDCQKALALYSEAAEAGNTLAQSRLGDLYYRGIGVDKDYEKALAYFQASAAKGHHHSQSRLGDMYLLGCGVKADCRKAWKLYQESAGQGNGHSQAQLGGMYLHGVEVDRDYAKALEWYLKAVAQGNDMAQANLGRMFEQGLGVAKDLQKALELYELSAAQGNGLGQARLADMFLNGWGVEQDTHKAVAWLRKSAAQGNDLAQLRLGALTCDGNGVEPDLKKGFELVRKSAEQGNAKAQLLLAGMYRNGKGVEPDNRKAFAWMQKSAKLGEGTAQYDLGCLYEQGSGVERDFQKARQWYLKAAEKGLDAAQVGLGNLYRNGLGVEENIDEARIWYIKAAEKGNEKAKAELLKIKLEADPEKRFRNRKAASFKGDAKAMAEVATMYLTGTGVEKNEENALEWFKKAFEYGNVSVRGELQRVQQAIAARRQAENVAPETTDRAVVPLPGLQKKRPPAVRTLRFPFSLIVPVALALAIVYFGFIKKAGNPDDESPAAVSEMAAVPQHKTEWLVPALLATGPAMSEAKPKAKPSPEQSEKKSQKIAATDQAALTVKPLTAALRREYRFLNEGEISAMLGARNFFDAQRNPGGNFGHQYEIKNVAGLRLIGDGATRLVWMRPQHPVKMNLEKITEWIASLNGVRYGGVSDWRLPTVEEAASLLQNDPADGKIFLDAIFGQGINSIWTGDGFSESRSWIVDFRNGLIDHVKNKNRLPALMVSSNAASPSAQQSGQQ